MADSAVLEPVLFDAAGFREFLDTRPPEERWELIEGLPMQSAAPRIGHQRIASNFERHLNAALRTGRPGWRADREIGIEVSSRSSYRPEPEVTVIDAMVDTERSFTERFYLVMEVPSASDRGRVLASKIRFYRAHPYNRFIVIVDQDAIEITIHERDAAGAWHVRVLRRLEDAFTLAGLGTICAVSALYENTRLDPRHIQIP
ncbi:Uma2 family endonuclease [uncultured Methylobacterium sp.]|uniref:Uma2 family endonuclease n=1 Tax=uncultured Methylobacterium sp. TaxID=157278 RepID=UPI0035CB7063